MARVERLKTPTTKRLVGGCSAMTVHKHSVYGHTAKCRAQPAYKIDGAIYCFPHAAKKAFSLLGLEEEK